MTMTQRSTVVGVFHEREQAREAIDALNNEGFAPEAISVLSPDKQATQDMAEETGTHAGGAAATGAVAGGILGGLGGWLLGGWPWVPKPSWVSTMPRPPSWAHRRLPSTPAVTRLRGGAS